MKQIIDGARAEFGHLPLNAGMIRWLEGRTGRTGSLQVLRDQVDQAIAAVERMDGYATIFLAYSVMHDSTQRASMMSWLATNYT